MHVIARMNVGGPAVEIAELMRGLDPAEFEQTLVTGWCADDEADYLQTQAPDVPSIRIDGFGRKVRPWDDARAVTDLVSLIRSQRPDIVHTHTAKAGVVGRLAAKASGRSAHVVHTFHGHLLHGYFSPAKTGAVIATERGLARITDRIITVGARVRDDLLAAGIGRPAQYTVIYSGVQLGSMPDRARARAELDVPDRARAVLFMGRITGIKRPDRLVDVAARLRDEPDLIFLVAGAGNEEASMRSRAAELNLPIRFLGWRSDIETLLAASDALILTSDNEGTPLSLVQGGLAGLPAVASDVGSVDEVVIDGRTGLLAPPDAAPLAAALRRILDDPELSRELGEQGRVFAQERFGMAAFLDGHARVYQEVGSTTGSRTGRRGGAW